MRTNAMGVPSMAVGRSLPTGTFPAARRWYEGPTADRQRPRVDNEAIWGANAMTAIPSRRGFGDLVASA